MKGLGLLGEVRVLVGSGCKAEGFLGWCRGLRLRV